MYKGIQSARLTRRRRHRRIRTYVCAAGAYLATPVETIVPCWHPKHECGSVLPVRQAAARLAFDGCRADPTSLLSQIRKYASYCIVG